MEEVWFCSIFSYTWTTAFKIRIKCNIWEKKVRESKVVKVVLHGVIAKLLHHISISFFKPNKRKSINMIYALNLVAIKNMVL